MATATAPERRGETTHDATIAPSPSADECEADDASDDGVRRRDWQRAQRREKQEERGAEERASHPQRVDGHARIAVAARPAVRVGRARDARADRVRDAVAEAGRAEPLGSAAEQRRGA
eukprot:6084852-Pleurochrysis_carterae.AAC.1